MASGPFLIGASLSRYGARGVAGEPVWRRAQQLRAAVEARLGGRHADLFAVPQVDEIGDKIDWYAPFDGVARGWSDLSDGERRALEGRVSELKPELERLVARLDSEGRGEGERAFGRLLREALVAPGSEALFSVGGRPVFAFWGFTGEGPTAQHFMGMLPPASSSTISVAAATAVAAAPVAAAAAPPAPEPAREAVLASTAPVAGPAWWKWALVASFLLIMLAAAAWYVRPYLPQWAWDGRIGLPAPDRPAAGPTTAALDDAPLRALRDRQAQLAADLASLRDQFVDKRKACTPGATGRVVPDTTVPTTPVPDTQADGGIVVLPDGTRVRPDGVVVDADGKPKLGPDGRPVIVDRDRPRTATAPTKPDATRPDAAKPDPRRPDVTAPKADTTKPPAAKPPAAKPDVAARPDTAKPDTTRPPAAKPDVATGKPPAGPARPPGVAAADKPIDPVKVPPGKGVEFMAGTWRSSTDLTTQGGDDVVRPQYTFDKDGKGKTRIVQKNGVVCEGPASAERDAQGRLVIRESEPLKCSDGTSYAPSTVTCQTDAAGRSTCSGSSEGGPGYVVTLGR
jgi:hypothetical protein